MCVSCRDEFFLGQTVKTFLSGTHLCVGAGRGQVLMSSAPLFAERNPRVEKLQSSPEAMEPLQHVLHAGLEILLNPKESKQRTRPVKQKCHK